MGLAAEAEEKLMIKAQQVVAELNEIAEKTEEEKFAASFSAAVREAEKKSRFKPGARR